MLPAWDELADHRGAGHLAAEQQPAGGLRVGQEQRLVLGDGRQIGVRAHPVEVAPGAAGDEAVGQRPGRRSGEGSCPPALLDWRLSHASEIDQTSPPQNGFDGDFEHRSESIFHHEGLLDREGIRLVW